MATTLTLSESIRIARRRAELDQDQLAEKVGVSRQLVSKWERGKSVPDLVQATRLAHVTGMPITWFSDVIDLTDQELSASGWTRRMGQVDYDEPTLFDPRLGLYDPPTTLIENESNGPGCTAEVIDLRDPVTGTGVLALCGSTAGR